MIRWLGPRDPFPPVDVALKDPNGLLAAGGDLSPERRLDAYVRGIFPWSGPDEPMLWWSPDPRMVLFVRELHISRSLRRRLRGGFTVTADTAFRAVVEACAGPRTDANGTWITPEVVEAYSELSRLGHAHSIETWIDGELAGGLYGVAIGRMFYGESMFARRSDASKIALAHLARQLEPNEHRPSRVARCSRDPASRVRRAHAVVDDARQRSRSLEARRRPDRDLPRTLWLTKHGLWRDSRAQGP